MQKTFYVLHAMSIFLRGWDRSLQCIFKVFALLSSQCPDLMASSTSIQGLVNKSYNIQPNFHFSKIPLSCLKLPKTPSYIILSKSLVMLDITPRGGISSNWILVINCSFSACLESLLRSCPHDMSNSKAEKMCSGQALKL